MRSIAVGMVVLAIGFGLPVWATTFYASPAGGGDGSSSESPTMLAAAVALAKEAGDGSEIVAGPGTYDITSELVLDKAIVLRSESGNPADTTLDAKGKSRVVTVNHPLAVLSGFTVMRGNVGYQYGGNALIWENGGTITNCYLVKHGDGKPIACGYGGGVAAVTGLVTHCLIADNQVSTQRGAGAWLAGYAVMRNCIISNNYHHTEYTQFGGGGLYIEGYKFSGTSTAVGNVVVENCTIVGNRQRNGGNINGAGIAVSGTSHVIRNCIIRDNKRNDTGAISDCSNLSVLRNCCISQTLDISPDANGNFTDDPQFAADDPFFGLASTKSPCYNAGLVFDWMTGATDFGGTVKRIENGFPDIGARELYTGNLLLCEFAPDVTSGSAPLNVTYTAVVSGAEVAETMFRWDLDGDGAFDREEKGLATVSYTYQSGAPDVTLVVEADTRAATNVVPAAVAVKSMEVFVSLDNPNARKPFDTWATAAATIRDALPYLEKNGVLTVDEGTYPQVYAFSLADGQRLRGRYGAERTVISGGGSVGKVISLSGGAVLEGVTVSDGGSGGNVSLNGATVTNCILRNTTGGGNNTGGGITSMGSSYVYNTVITNCVSGSWGYGDKNSAGGIFVNTGTLTAYNTLIANCRTTSGNHPGGTCGNAVLVNCTVADCQNTKSGGTMPGGMNAGQCKNSIIANCKCGTADSPYSGTTFNHACVYPASAAISGAITNNPCFKGGSNPYALSFASPCRNAGDNSLVKGTVDLAGKPRKVDRVVDIGCYEADPAGLSVIVK